MTPQELFNPRVGRLVAAINDADPHALLATLPSDATLTDAGHAELADMCSTRTHTLSKARRTESAIRREGASLSRHAL
jgi:hypothetical protein